MHARNTLMFAAVMVACSGDGAKQHAADTATRPPPPIFLTVAGHIEDNAMYTNCADYLLFREKLLDFSEFVHARGVPLRLQASYEWFRGAALCEDAAVMASTAGVSSLDYLVSAFGFAIDTHQEGASVADATSGNNFADIHWAGEQVSSHLSDVTGFQWDNPVQYESFQAGEVGLLHPEHVWSPQILSGGVSGRHTDGDFTADMSSIGVWIPSGFDEARFHEHDASDDGRMVYVGSGPNQWVADWGPDPSCHFEKTSDVIVALSSQLEDGRLPADGIYTYTFFIPQRVIFDPAAWPKLEASLDVLAPLVADGRVVWSQHEDVVEAWRAAGEVPFILTYDEINDEAQHTCD